jgi:hypothetical protein
LETACAICGAARGLDRHHVTPRRMGGSRDPQVLGEGNLLVLCRSCHANIHEARWVLTCSDEGLWIHDARTGDQVMRRLRDATVDPPKLFQLLNLAADSYSHVLDALPYLSDEELVEAFGYARSFGKHAWLVQAAVLHEAQARSIYGDQTLAAVARRFDISLRQAEKYAAVWQWKRGRVSGPPSLRCSVWAAPDHHGYRASLPLYSGRTSTSATASGYYYGSPLPTLSLTNATVAS